MPMPTAPEQHHVPDAVVSEGPSGEQSRSSRDSVPIMVERRAAWERGFAAWDGGALGVREGVAAVARAGGVSEGVARVWIETGEVSLGLPSYRERLRDAAREVVARDRRGESLEAVERRGMEAMARDRARALAEARRVESKVLGDAVTQRAEEAKLVRGVRQTATAMLSAEAHLLKAALGLAKSIDEDVSTGRLAMKPREKVALVKDIATIVKQTAETARLAVATERMVIGKPGTVLGPDDAAVSNMTPDEAEAYVAIAQRAIARRARQRIVIDAEAESADDAAAE